MHNTKDPLALMQDVIFLKNNPIFSNVRTKELRAIAAISQDCSYPSGSKIVTEGDPGDSLFLVKTGNIKITKLIQNNEVTLATLPPTSCFGEMVIFEDEPRSANAYAENDCLLMVIQKEELIDVIKQYPDIAIQLFRVLGGRLRAANEKVKELSSKLGDKA
ncbi:MAG: Crp/Fnr family transcriptional regulator [Fibrobacteria bacterium]|nr:Crp/Fnr family transcriptional regulator [Fibrobacteria bacterium]